MKCHTLSCSLLLMKQRPRSIENNDACLPPPWVRGSRASLLTSHVMTNSERLPPPPLTLAGVTFGTGRRRRISLALLTSHNAEKAHVITFHVATDKWQREVTFWRVWTSTGGNPVRYQQTSHSFGVFACVANLWCFFIFLNQRNKTHKGANLGESSFF